MKDFVKRVLQRFFGFDNYLFVFALFKISTLKLDKKENDFFYFLRLIPEKGIIIDIGANIGIMAYHLSKQRPGCDVHCFEPVKENYTALSRVVRFFSLKNIVTHFLALGNETGRVKMIMPSRNSIKLQGLSHVVTDNSAEGGALYDVDIKKLDECELAANSTRVVAIKLDVENFEYNVLAGAENMLKKNMPVVYCELWENENRDKCISLMQKLGYKVKVVAGKSLAEYDKELSRTQNFFFLPPSFEQ